MARYTAAPHGRVKKLCDLHSAALHRTPLAAPQAPAAPVLGCGHASERAYPGTDGVSRCEPCFNASTAGVCDHCGKHVAKRTGAYHQMVCSPCLHRDTDARIADARERTPVTVGRVSPWARNSLTF
jgi:hypothetical protein